MYRGCLGVIICSLNYVYASSFLQVRFTSSPPGSLPLLQYRRLTMSRTSVSIFTDPLPCQVTCDWSRMPTQKISPGRKSGLGMTSISARSSAQQRQRTPPSNTTTQTTTIPHQPNNGRHTSASIASPARHDPALRLEMGLEIPRGKSSQSSPHRPPLLPPPFSHPTILTNPPPKPRQQ
jgi:hypothetical protein